MRFELPERRPHRMEKDVYATRGLAVHVIIDTEERKPIFADGMVAEWLFKSIINGPISVESELYAVCVMPNHIHLLLVVIDTNIVDLIGRWKSFTTNALVKKGFGQPAWQRSFYDHILTSDESLLETAEYIIRNPVRARIVDDASGYSYVWHRWMD